MRLLLVRHGQTPSNVVGALDTSIPGPGLTGLGRRQAAALPGVLAPERVDGLFVSRLIRTHQTAAPLADALGLDPVELAGTHEVQAGDMEMRSDRAAVRAYFEAILAWGAGDRGVRMPGGESGDEFFGRFDAGIREVQERVGDGTAVVFNHGAAMRLWVQVYSRNLEEGFTTRADLDNTGIAVMQGDLDAGFELLEWRGTSPAGLVDESADDVTGEPVAEAIADAD